MKAKTGLPTTRTAEGPFPFHQAYTYVMDNLAPITIQLEGDNFYMFPIIIDGSIMVGVRLQTA